MLYPYIEAPLGIQF